MSGDGERKLSLDAAPSLPTATPAPDDEGADLVAEAVDPTPPRMPAEAKTGFQPWHKPRKQFIRRQQWCDEVGRLITELARLRRADAEIISYLTLPGDELLDIRCLHDACEQKGARLRYLGFNAGRGKRTTTECDLSRAEVRQLANIDDAGSRVVHDHLESITHEKSMGYDALAKNASYDVINLDLCGSVASDPPMTSGSTLTAIQTLLNVQRTSRAAPWLLFLTTRSDGGQIDAGVWDRLLKLIEANKAGGEEFASALAALPLGADPAAWRGDQEQFHRAFMIGFGKWLLSLSGSGQPRWRVSLASAYAYSVTRRMDMLSLSFRFDLIVDPLQDPTKLVETQRAAAAQAVTDERKWAAEIARSAAACADVDAVLDADSSLRKLMIDESAALLAAARYSREEYLRWVES